jgi:hypothetical protein
MTETQRARERIDNGWVVGRCDLVEQRGCKIDGGRELARRVMQDEERMALLLLNGSCA